MISIESQKQIVTKSVYLSLALHAFRQLLRICVSIVVESTNILQILSFALGHSVT